jgi:ATP phosphoribosyltransferase regulatory subunit
LIAPAQREPLPGAGAAGFRDLLPDEAERIADVEASIASVMRAWGYRPVMTPVVERTETIARGLGSEHLQRLLKLTDFDGSVLALVGERTVPIARLAAGPMRNEELPLRLCYTAPVVSRRSGGFGGPRQVHQAGAELIGATGAAADAEVIALAVRALEAAGVDVRQVDIGHADFVNGLLAGFRASAEVVRGLRDALAARDFVELEAILERSGLRDAEHELLLRFPALRGGAELLEAAASTVTGGRAERALGDLRQVLAVLGHHGVAGRVRIDLGAIRDLDYYSGVVFEVHGEDAARAVAQGGRYDALLQRFGRDVASTGFVIHVETAAEAVDRGRRSARPAGVAVAWSGEGLAQALELAASLRLFGLCAIVDTAASGRQAARRRQASARARHLVHCDGRPSVAWIAAGRKPATVRQDELVGRLVGAG